MDLKLDKTKNKNFQSQLALFFEQYKNICVRENGVLLYENRDDLEVFGEKEPLVITQLNKLLSSFTSITGGMSKGNLKIYKVKRRDKVSFPPQEKALSRVLLIVGDDAFAKTSLNTSGVSTGRAPVITKLIEGGSTQLLKPNQEFSISGSVKEKVFVKGKGKQEMVKPEKFEQYLVFYELIYDDQMLKSLRKEILSGGLDNVMKQNKDEMEKVLEEAGMGSLTQEIEAMMDKTEGKESGEGGIEITDEDREFL